MAKGYHHLTIDIRCQIYALMKSGLSGKCIGKQLNLSQSTISRELRRNREKRGYRFKQAHVKALSRRIRARFKPSKMTPELIPFMERMIREKKYSPEQISGRLKLVEDFSISHETIYKYIWSDKKQGGDL